MGTNYYWHPGPPCEKCGLLKEGLHIGKSSAGWCFALHIIPEEGIGSLADWKEKFKTGYIRDEYDESHTVEEMLERITERGRDDVLIVERAREASGELGPKNLIRHRIGYGCVAHGEGTWDLVIGEFS